MANILIVDDVSANRKFLVTLLRYAGHQLTEAVDGSAALAAVRAAPPDLVITDVLMPVMDGYELVRQLRLDPATHRIPVVFYTAHYGEREARELALSSGVAFVLAKPAESAAVLAIVARALSGEPRRADQAGAAALSDDFDREHLRLVTDKLSSKAGDLRVANARLRALINIGLELASERDSDRLIESVCATARDLFGATYVTLGILDPSDKTVLRFVTGDPDSAKWIAVGDSVSGILVSVVTERSTLRGNNLGGDPVMLGLPSLHPVIESYLAAPISSPAHGYGWICLVNNEGRVFSEDDEHLLMALAGQVGRIYEVEHEILERMRTEAALRRERDSAQRYLDSAEVILLKLDVDGRIKLVNRYACGILGWTAEELLGKQWMEMCLPPRLRCPSRLRLDEMLATGLPTLENVILTRAGEERIIDWRIRVVHDDDGAVIGTFSCGTDVTERNEAAMAVQAAEERMRFAMQTANVGIWDLDYSSGVLRWSETLEAQYGLAPGAFAGSFDAFLARVHPEDRPALLETVGKAMTTGSDFATLFRTMWDNGTVRWLSGGGRVALGAHGEPVRAVGISLDVTDRRSLEEQYQHAQRMEAVGRLAGGVAHDFNNLLTAILGYSDLLLAEMDVTDTHRADVTEINKAGQRGATLTKQLLAFSRKQIIEPTLFDLNVVVEDMRGLLARLIGEDVQIAIQVHDRPAPITADRGQVEQIVMNLAVNARDAMLGGGTLTITTAIVELDEAYARIHLAVTPGEFVMLKVADTGSGMTPEVQARLFEPFFTTKEAGKGTGLGLATVHGIVARNGASITVQSDVGAGTCFTVYFPLAHGLERVVEVPDAILLAPVGTQTVLVVEDEEGLRELTSRMLLRLGYSVLTAANAADALRLFAQNLSIDVLLTDVVMPGASGPELTRQLLERRPTLKVLYMSGYTEESIVHHGVLNPGIALLHKPFTSEALGLKLRQVLDVRTAA